jgi:hypothetical protein
MTMTVDKERKLISFDGEIRWASIPPNQPRGPSPEYTTNTNKNDLTYSVEVECSEEEFNQLTVYKLPKLISLKKDEETGKSFLRVKATKRKTNTDASRNNGVDYLFKDLPVVDKEGKMIKVPLANGSKALVRVGLIEVKHGHILRLMGVLVTEVLEYKPDNVFSDLVETIEQSTDTVETTTDETVSQIPDDFGF